MKAAALRSAATYVVLVGVPLVGLVAILRVGRGLEAAAPVGGEWTLADGASLACAGLPADATLAIAQSGRFLEVRAGELVADGRIERGHLIATTRARGGECEGAELVLDARLEGDALHGTLGAPSCDACPPSRLVAHRAAAD